MLRLVLVLLCACSTEVPPREVAPAPTVPHATAEALAAEGASVPERPAAPDYVQGITVRHAVQGKTPEGALKVWFDVLQDVVETGAPEHEEALAFLTLPLKEDPEWRGRPSSRFFLDQLRRNPHILRSYAEGSRPDNGYARERDWSLAVETVGGAGDRGTKVVLRSSGADASRPVYLKRSTRSGLWYVSDFANVYVGIRPPFDPDAETFE